MVEEYHNEFVHVIVDYKTGNDGIDEGVEKTIKGFVHMVLYALETGRMNELVEKTRAMFIEFSEQTVSKK